MTGTGERDRPGEANGPNGPNQPNGVEVTGGGDPSDEELAAIVAAVEVAWPRPAAPAPAEDPPRWRFSGRWWSKPVPLRRSRPW